MKIKEVSAITGLTQKTIRFYESAGLISPRTEDLNGRAFRDYSETDIEHLKEIAVLRKARFSIEEIKQMQTEPQAVQEIFACYHNRMQQEKNELDKLLLVLDSISSHTFESKSELVNEILDVTDELTLPFIDIHPNFKYIDMLEEKLKIKENKNRDKKARLNHTVAMTQGASLAQYQTRPGVRDGSMPGASVIMTMRLLDDD